jgi:class 3 adenylate cyclase
LGEGSPLVYIPPSFSHIQMEWQYPEIRRWYERLAQGRQLVRYDHRGYGLSQRDVPEFVTDAPLRDLDAVVNRLGLQMFALFGSEHAGPMAINYAVRHPERVSHLILFNAYSRAAEWTSAAQIRATRALMHEDWETYTETIAHVVYGWSQGQRASRYADLIRASVAPEIVRQAIPLASQVDVTAILPDVKQPTLVLHRRQARFPAVDAARKIASRTPDAHLVVLEGEALVPYLDDWEAVASAIDEFLGDAPSLPKSAPSTPAVHTILFTDVEGSTALTQRLGDAKGREVLREHERITRDVLAAHGGTEVKTMGDGFMASFGSVTKAVECAIALQRAFAEREGEPLSVRVGLNAGEPIEEEGDLFGATVILASRIAAKAEGGEIFVSDNVRSLCSGKGFLFSDRGEFVAKGFEEPVRVYEVRWREGD